MTTKILVVYILIAVLFTACRTAKLRMYTTNDSNVVRIDTITTIVKKGTDSTRQDSIINARHHVHYLNHPKTLRPLVPGLIILAIVSVVVLILLNNR